MKRPFGFFVAPVVLVLLVLGVRLAVAGGGAAIEPMQEGDRQLSKRILVVTGVKKVGDAWTLRVRDALELRDEARDFQFTDAEIDNIVARGHLKSREDLRGAKFVVSSDKMGSMPLPLSDLAKNEASAAALDGKGRVACKALADDLTVYQGFYFKPVDAHANGDVPTCGDCQVFRVIMGKHGAEGPVLGEFTCEWEKDVVEWMVKTMPGPLRNAIRERNSNSR